MNSVNPTVRNSCVLCRQKPACVSAESIELVNDRSVIYPWITIVMDFSIFFFYSKFEIETEYLRILWLIRVHMLLNIVISQLQRRINVDATSWRYIDVNTTLCRRHVPAGIWTGTISLRPRKDWIITKTRLYNFNPLKPHFYIVKLGFTGVYIIFLISAQNIDCGYSLEPPRRGGSNEYLQSLFWAGIWKISEVFIWKFSVLEVKFYTY